MSRVFKVDYIPDPAKGRPLWNAKIFVGVANQDPTIPSNQIQLTGDIGFPVGQSIPVPQPVRTNAGGITVYNNSPLDLNAPGQEYAIQIFDRNDNLIYNFPQVDGSVVMNTTSQEEVTGLTIWPEVGEAVIGQTIPAGTDAIRYPFNGRSTLFTIKPPVAVAGTITNITINSSGIGELEVDNSDVYDLAEFNSFIAANDGDSQLAGGNIWPLSSQESAQVGDDLSGYEFLRLSGGDFPSIQLFRMVRKDGAIAPVSGALDSFSLSLSGAIPEAVIGGDDYWLFDANHAYDQTEISINAAWADETGVRDCSPSLSAVSGLLLALYSEGPAPEAGFTFTAISPTVTAIKGKYTFSETWTINTAYFECDLGMSVWQPSPSFDLNDFFIHCTTIWNGKIKNYKMRNVLNNIKIANPNLGLGQIEIDGVQQSGGDVYLDTDCRSTRVTVSNYRLDKVKHPAIIRTGDIVKFSKGWFKAGVLDDPYTGFFDIAETSQSAKLIIQDMFYNPTPQTANDVFVVKASDPQCTVDIYESLFGGEAGQVPAVGWFGDSPNVGAAGRGGTIRFRDLSYFSAQSSPTNDPSGRRAMIELYALPNTVTFENVAGLPEGSDQRGLIFFRDDFQTFQNALTFNAETQIWFDNRIGHRGVGEYITDEAEDLAQFVRSENPTFYRRTGDINNSTSEDLFIPSDDFQQRRTFRVILYLASSSQTDAYSEYLIQAAFGQTPGSLSAVYEGSAPGAPRLAINGSDIEITLNSDINLRQVRYEVQKVGSPVGGF